MLFTHVSRETRCGAARPAPPLYCAREWGLAAVTLVSRETRASNLSAVVPITAFGTNPRPDPSINTHGKAPAPGFPAPGAGPWHFWKRAGHGPHCRRHAPAMPGRGPDHFLPESGPLPQRIPGSQSVVAAPAFDGGRLSVNGYPELAYQESLPLAAVESPTPAGCCAPGTKLD